MASGRAGALLAVLLATAALAGAIIPVPKVPEEQMNFHCCRVCDATEAKPAPGFHATMFKMGRGDHRTRLPSCCPVCPWKEPKEKPLAPLSVYFTSAKDQRQKDIEQYEAEMTAAAKAGAGESAGEGAGEGAGGASASDSEGFFFEMFAGKPRRKRVRSRSRPPKRQPLKRKRPGKPMGPKKKAGKRRVPDPFHKTRGMEMNRWETHVYGSPADKELAVLRAQQPLPKPPCCTFCKRNRDNLATEDPKCCVQCGVTPLVLGPAAFPYRPFSEDEPRTRNEFVSVALAAGSCWRR
jgi:hypothetical protein